MDKSMWALVYDRKKDPWSTTRGLRKEQVARPTLDVGKDYRDASMVIVKPRFAGFCGSDRGIWFRRAFGDMIHRPWTPRGRTRGSSATSCSARWPRPGRGHPRLRPRPGDVVSTESHIICNTCYQCRIGDNHVCATDRIIGISMDGCFAEYVKLPAQALWPTDITKIRPEVAALQEPFGNAVHACTKVNLRGKSVAIIGCGTIGLFAVAVAKAMGAARSSASSPCRATSRWPALGADDVVEPTKSPRPPTSTTRRSRATSTT